MILSNFFLKLTFISIGLVWSNVIADSEVYYVNKNLLTDYQVNKLNNIFKDNLNDS